MKWVGEKVFNFLRFLFRLINWQTAGGPQRTNDKRFVRPMVQRLNNFLSKSDPLCEKWLSAPSRGVLNTLANFFAKFSPNICLQDEQEMKQSLKCLQTFWRIVSKLQFNGTKFSIKFYIKSANHSIWIKFRNFRN